MGQRRPCRWTASQPSTLVDVFDKYTVRFNLTMPDVALPSSVMHYPTNLQAPDNFDQASDHPIGTGPCKFVSWTRFASFYCVSSTP